MASAAAGAAGGALAGAIAGEVVDGIRQVLEQDDLIQPRVIRDAILVALQDHGEQRRSNDYLVRTVAAGSTDVVPVIDEFHGNPGYFWSVITGPSTGLTLRINAGPPIPDVQPGHEMDHFDITELSIDNQGSSSAVIIIGGRIGQQHRTKIDRSPRFPTGQDAPTETP